MSVMLLLPAVAQIADSVVQATDTVAQAADTVRLATAALPAPPPVPPLTAAGFVLAGGWSLAVVALAVVAALAAVARALRTLRDAGDDGDEVIRTVGGFIRGGNLVGAVDYCQSQDSVAGRVVSEGVQRLGRPIGDIQTAVAAAARREAARLTGALDTVRSSALVAALAGVLGTATGLASLLRAAGDAAPAGGALWPALVPAAVGAGVGLLLVGLFHAVAGRTADAAAALDTITGDFLNLLRGPAG